MTPLRAELRGQMEIIMRVYFEKPRTTIGWKGLINDPHMDGSYDIEAGLQEARALLLELTSMGLPAATEFLDPIIPQYIDDLVTWVAIGARTTESQTHREMASGLSMPVGFKNGTDGSLQIALDAMLSARTPHNFLGIDQDGVTSIIRTTGNPVGHLVLRGGRSQPQSDRRRRGVGRAGQRPGGAHLLGLLLEDKEPRSRFGRRPRRAGAARQRAGRPLLPARQGPHGRDVSGGVPSSAQHLSSNSTLSPRPRACSTVAGSG